MCVQGQVLVSCTIVNTWWELLFTDNLALCWPLCWPANAALSTFNQMSNCLHHVIYMTVCETQACMNTDLENVPEYFPVEHQSLVQTIQFYPCKPQNCRFMPPREEDALD